MSNDEWTQVFLVCVLEAGHNFLPQTTLGLAGIFCIFLRLLRVFFLRFLRLMHFYTFEFKTLFENFRNNRNLSTAAQVIRIEGCSPDYSSPPLWLDSLRSIVQRATQVSRPTQIPTTLCLCDKRIPAAICLWPTRRWEMQ